jgi:hypothetical protein
MPATLSTPATTPTLPAVANDPATATLPDVATEPATATLPAVATDPATARCRQSPPTRRSPGPDVAPLPTTAFVRSMGQSVDAATPSVAGMTVDLEVLLADLRTLVEVESPSLDLPAVEQSAATLAALIEERLGSPPELVPSPPVRTCTGGTTASRGVLIVGTTTPCTRAVHWPPGRSRSWTGA